MRLIWVIPGYYGLFRVSMGFCRSACKCLLGQRSWCDSTTQKDHIYGVVSHTRLILYTAELQHWDSDKNNDLVKRLLCYVSNRAGKHSPVE